MPRNSPLNEKGQISAYKLEGKSISFIARELLRSWTVVRNYLKDTESYGTRKRPGRPLKITNAARRRLFREASKERSSSRDLQKNSGFTHHSKKSSPTSPWITKSRILKQEDSLCFNYFTVVVMEGKQNSARYINVLEKILPIYESSRHE